MSVINKMLRDLDKRGQLSARGMEIPEVESKPSFREESNRGKIVIAIAIVGLIAAAGWILLQPEMQFWKSNTAVATTPAAKPVVAARVEPKAGAPASTAPVEPPPSQASPQSPGFVTNAASNAANAATASAEAVTAAVKAARAPNEPVKAAPASPEKGPVVAAVTSQPPTGQPQAAPAPATKAAEPPASGAPALKPKMAEVPMPTSMPEPPKQDVSSDSGQISIRPIREAPPAAASPKRAAPAKGASAQAQANAPREQSRAVLAAQNYASARDLMSQGKLDAAIDAYDETLRLDPAHVGARQAMVALLLDRRRIPETQSVLREGLAVHPENLAWSMLLARLQVEGNDIPGALDTLEKALPYGKDQADYHGFVATLLQMQSRHKDAIAHYDVAVRLAPESGRWLLGLALSLEQEKRSTEARDAYRRALASNNLGKDHEAFVERKLKQWQ